MTTRRSLSASGLVVLLVCATGCSMANMSQMERCQNEKKQLLARVVEEQKRAEALTTELRSSNQRLAEAEKQVARMMDGSRTRYASGPGNSGFSGLPAPSLGTASRPFSPGPEPLGATGMNGSSPGRMASTPAAPRPLPFSAPRSSAPSGSSAPAQPSLDPSGFDQLAPLNGRSESGWMPKSPSRP